MQKTKVKGIGANLHIPVPFYSLGGQAARLFLVARNRSAAAAALLATPARMYNTLDQIGAMSHTLDGPIDSASMRPKRTLSAIPRSSG